MNISGDVSVAFVGDEKFSASLQTAKNQIKRQPSRSFTSGTGAQKCDLMWAKSYTVAASASQTVTVSALTDDFGRAVAFARVKVCLIETDATVSGDDLVVGAASSNPWTDIVGGSGQTFRVKPYGMDLKVAMGATAFVVTASTSDQLKIANVGANPITFRITLAGCSA